MHASLDSPPATRSGTIRLFHRLSATGFAVARKFCERQRNLIRNFAGLCRAIRVAASPGEVGPSWVDFFRLRKTFELALWVLAIGISSDVRAATANLLSASWQFTATDNPAYARSDFDASAWPILGSGRAWETQGYYGYDGYGWYRQTVTISSDLRANAESYGGFTLQLGKIDDCDETYFNGTLIGASGQFPPRYSTAYDADRTYIIPANLVHWGAPNVIAVRVYDNGGDGGLYSGTPTLTVRTPLTQLAITPDFDRSDRVLLSGSRRAGVSFASRTSEPVNLTISQSVTSDTGVAIATEVDTAKIPGHSQTSLAFAGGDLQPGFYSAALSLAVTGEQTQLTVPFAVEPEKVIYPPDRQSDFPSFWDTARAELRNIDPQYRVTLHTVQPFTNKTVYLVEMRSLGNVRIRGWLGVPNRPGKHPAILHLQGYSYGFSPTDMYGGDEFVTLALNIRGHGNSQDDFNPGFPNFLITGLGSPATYVYRGAFMDCVRAVDFLVSRPEVDATHIAVEGGSQGGTLCFATAALDSRVALCVPHIPGFSEYRTWFQMVPNTASIFWFWRQQNGRTEDDVYRTLSYFDIKNLAPWIKVPTLMGVGLRDPNCPPRIGFAAFNNLGGAREWLIYPEAPHSLPSSYHSYKIAWIKRQWGMPLENLIASQPRDQVVVAGQDATFTTEVAGAPTTRFQWQRRAAGAAWTDLTDDSVYRGATAATLTVGAVDGTMFGDKFRCVVTNETESVTTNECLLVCLTDRTASETRLVNLSVRSRAGAGDETLILGFVIAGRDRKQLLLRGVGPGLLPYGVTEILADPLLRLFDSAGSPIDENDDWGTSSATRERFAALGAFSLAVDSKDAALDEAIGPGPHTVHITTRGAQSGVALLELYDGDASTTSRLVNVSARSMAGTGDNTLIAGFVVRGQATAVLLVRAVGPTLAQHGVSQALTNPRLRLYDRSGAVMAENDDWIGAVALKSVFAHVGASALESDTSRDSALLVQVPPGVYTAHVSSVGADTGIALIEVYEVL